MFKCIRVLEFNTIIGKDYREEPPEQCMTEDFGQSIKDLQYTVLCAIIHQKNKHKACFSKDHCEKNFALSSTAFNSVHFYNGKTGIGLYE